MLVGGAIVPAAPLLVPGVSATLPDGVGPVRGAVDGVIAGLPDADVTVVVAASAPAGAYRADAASLAGFGRPDLARPLPPIGPQGHRGPLPPALAVLALLARDAVPLLPFAVDPDVTAGQLTAHGAALASDSRRVVVIAAGDCSAALEERSPRYAIDGAVTWDEEIVAAVAAEDPAALARLGPDEARRVAALGWAPMVVARAALGRPFRVRHYSAPCGVGYLVADG